jgi:hypothetical protein
MMDRMSGRYTPPPAPNFAGSHAFGSEPEPKRKKDPLEDFLRMGAGVAPALGAVGGGLLGTFAMPGLGTAAGAGLGMAAGQGVGSLMTGGADMMAEDDEQAAQKHRDRELERQARVQAALQLLR